MIELVDFDDLIYGIFVFSLYGEVCWFIDKMFDMFDVIFVDF